MDLLLPLLLCPVVFFTTVTSQDDTVCHRPELGFNIEVDEFQMYFSPGAELTLSCKHGHTPVQGPRKIVCGESGQWTKTNFKCMPKRCPPPDRLSNGELHYNDNVYQSTINYTCNEGYIMSGSNTAVCQANGTWSAHVPVCTPVTCGLAPIPLFGMIIYDRKVSGNTTNFGLTGMYKCLPPHALFGNPRAECTADGTWTETPECRVVTCIPPQNIDNGYMSNQDQRLFDYMEKIKYGCQGDYVLEGSREIVCQSDGTWSEKPSCMAPCTVNIKRGRVLYNGEKVWIEDFNPNRVLHKEFVSVYCKNKARNCGYAASTQCINGRLTIPECFAEPGRGGYVLNSRSLPSEITQC